MRGAIAAAVVVALAAGTAGGKEPTLAELSGEVTVVAFWATWCPPCRAELPMVESLRKAVADDPRVRVVAVSVDEASDAGAARALARAVGIGAPLVVDKKLYARLFGRGELAVPRLIVVDRALGGLERLGARKGEDPDAFVRDVRAAVAAIEAGGGAPPAPSPMWRPFHAPAR
jgi:thiol-disulfide isomerase/thioredoxin